MNRQVFCGIALLIAVALHADLAAVRGEPNLEKRARLALDHAFGALTAAQGEYEKGDLEGATASISEMRESVELAKSALAATGKNPVRSPKHFKQAEVRSRELLKRLDGFEQSMDFADRSVVDRAKTKIQEIHDDWLLGVMGNKK